VLYEVEVGHISVGAALAATLEAAELEGELAEFSSVLVQGVTENRDELDSRLSKLILEYAYDRVAAVDRNVMRIAAFELIHLPAVPPAVILNEAVEIAKKYSTAESGKFVNGVLGKLLLGTPKADWNPASAPAEAEEVGAPDPAAEVEVIEIDADEAEKLLKVGGWTVRSKEPK